MSDEAPMYLPNGMQLQGEVEYSRHWFELVSDKPGPLTMYDFSRIWNFILMHEIPADAVITKIYTEPHWKHTKLHVDWKPADEHVVLPTDQQTSELRTDAD